MGNTSSIQEEEMDRWWVSEPVSHTTDPPTNTSIDESTSHITQNEEMEEFRAELARKRALRREILDERKNEIMALRKENEELKLKLTENQTTVGNSDLEELRQTALEAENLTELNRKLRLDIAKAHQELQEANSQIAGFEQERSEYKEHVTALKDVVKVTKEMLHLRECQMEELRNKISTIEAALAERETGLLSKDLRAEYERQLRNIKSLKELYEQRQAAARAERHQLAERLAEADASLQAERSNVRELQERVEELQTDVSNKYDTVSSLESQLGLSHAECRELQQELAAINQMFSQVLLGFNNCQEVDLDKMVQLLQENHGLLTDIVGNEQSSSSSALPKVLLDLVNRANEGTSDEASALPPPPPQTTQGQINSAAQIVDNLPKVWRVLAELLSQHNGSQSAPPVALDTEGEDPCYKCVQTPKGPQLVLSVSQTFIRLKDLIMEKRSLEKEMTRLKQLNIHLEVRLQDQEKRLEAVSSELSKTWHVVGRMQKQHQQLHTHEKILRYELAQKRKLLTELKQELEYCREKWEQAREKNSTTEEEWKKLRTEFASRKTIVTDDLNNSGESGYSDERECSSDEESNKFENKVEMAAAVVTSNVGENTNITDIVTPSQENDSTKENVCTNFITAETTSDIKNNMSHSDSTQKTETEDGNIELPKTEDQPSTSTNKTYSQDELLARREARLKRLEEQCQQLVNKVTNTSNRGVQICSKLETLHEQYGGDNSKSREGKDN